MPLSFASWQALINNFAIEQAGFTGIEIGILQSLREVPGFLAFAVLLLLLVLREQTIAFVALLALGMVWIASPALVFPVGAGRLATARADRLAAGARFLR